MLTSIFLICVDLILRTSSSNLPLQDCKNDDIDLVIMIDDFTENVATPTMAIENIINLFLDIRQNSTGTLRVAISGIDKRELFMPFKELDPNTTKSQVIDMLNAVKYDKGAGRLDTFSRARYGRANVRNVTIAFSNSPTTIFIHYLGMYLELHSNTDSLLIIHSQMALMISKELKLQWFHKNVIVADMDNLLQDMKLVYLSICGQCPDGWRTFEQKPFVTSCYKLMEPKETISSYEAERVCSEHNSDVVNLETKEELFFVQEMLASDLSYINKKAQSLEPRIPIGLGQFRRGQWLRYQWSNGRPFMLGSNKVSQRLQHNRPHICVSMSIINETSNINDIDKMLFNHDCTSDLFNVVLCELELLTVWTSFEEHTSDKTTIISQDATMQNKTFFFDCEEDDQYVHYYHVCDGFRNCRNGLDETWCSGQRTNWLHQESILNYEYLSTTKFHEHIGSYYSFYFLKNECKEILYGKDRCLPSQWCSGHECFLTYHEDPGFLCTNTMCSIKFEYVICGSNGSTSQSDRCNRTTTGCDTSDVSNLAEGEINWAPKCIYVRGASGYPFGCPDLSHLDNCEKFTCPDNMVKCPHSYCILVHYVGDKIMDCTYGEDETNQVHVGDVQLNQCLINQEPGELIGVCNYRIECANLADELNCPVYCPESFICQDGVTLYDGNSQTPLKDALIEFDGNTRVLKILNVDLSKFLIFPAPHVLELYIINCKIQSDDYFFKQIEVHFNHTYKVDFSYNDIKSLTNQIELFSFFPNVLIINMSHNYNLYMVQENSIRSTFLRIIDFSYTQISSLPSHILESRFLQLVNLSNTLVTSLHWLPHNMKLNTLDLSNTKINVKSLTRNIYHDATVTEKLKTDHYKLCCALILGPNTSPHVCTSPHDVISSCGDLLADRTKRFLLWAVAFFSVAGNLAVLFHRFAFDRSILKQSYGIFITNLCCSDLTMGIYLLIIASVDMHFRDVYVLHENKWRSSSLCTAAGFLSTLSSETSTFFVFLITVDRFMAIRFPFGDFRFSKPALILSVLLAWTIGFIISLIPAILPDLEIYSSNGMCLGLPLTYNKESGWTYSMSVFIILNFVIFIFAATGQLAIYLSATSDLKLTVHSQARRQQNVDIAMQLCLIAMSNFMCWFPVCVIGLRSMAGYAVSLETYAWILVLVLPLNSAVNPNIYTIPFLYRKWKDFKRGSISRHTSEDI